MNQIADAKFRYTFPITKSEQRGDGNYLIGYASGPEIDSEFERMAPNAIVGFADQINSSDETNRLVYRDAHAPDGVLRDLGEITKAWVTDQMHLGIEVKLDSANPASQYLWSQINKGKQYGMSVAGRVLEYADEFVSEVGAVVRTYKNIALDEISNTTRPAWYPSFGSVLAKSIKDAEDPDVEKAKWSTAYVNSLPDSSFAYIEDGGKKDADGKTTPRSLRHFPYKDENGKVDAAHVRNGLSQLPKSKLSDSAKATVKAKLLAAAKQVGITVSEKSATTDDRGDNTLSDEVLLDDTVKDEAKSDVADGNPDVQKYSSAANDAASAAYVLTQLLSILGGETDESDAADADKIRTAISAIQDYITSETAEVGTAGDTVAYSDDSKPEDSIEKSDDEPEAEADADAAVEEEVVEDETDKSDVSDDADDIAKAGKKVSAQTAKVILGVHAKMKETMAHMEDAMGSLGILDGNESLSSTKSASEEVEETVVPTPEPEPVDELAVLRAANEDLQATLQKATARIEELANTPRTDLPPLITDETRKSEEDEFAEILRKASPSERLRLSLAAQTRGR